MNIGETLKKLRQDRGLTQEDVINKLGISQTYLSQLERDRKEPSGEMLRKICKLYKVAPQIVVWQSLQEKDIQKNKLAIFKELKPAVDDLIAELLK